MVVDSLNGREAPGRAGALPREPLTSGGEARLRSPAAAHGRTSLRGPAPLLPAAAVPTPCPPSRGCCPTAAGFLRRLGRPPTDSPRGAARPARPRCLRFPPPPPRLPANARDTAGRQPPSLSSGSELTRSKRPPRHPPLQRRPLLRTRTQAPPSSARGMRARHAGKESFLDARSSAPPPAGGGAGSGSQGAGAAEQRGKAARVAASASSGPFILCLDVVSARTSPFPSPRRGFLTARLSGASTPLPHAHRTAMRATPDKIVHLKHIS